MTHGHKIDGFYFMNKKEIKCPQCGKMFQPAPEHSYHEGNAKVKLVCSYHCMREWEKEHPTARSKYIKNIGRRDKNV